MATKPARLASLAAGFLLALGSTGCFAPRGYLFTYRIEPYALPNGVPAQRGDKRCAVNITQLKEPFSHARLSVVWTDRAVVEAAERAGIQELRYADLQTLSVFNETYLRRRLLFYGD